MKKFFTCCAACFAFCLAIMGQPGKWAWAAGQTLSDIPSGFNYRQATDKEGNVYVGGYFYSSTISYGPYTFNNALNDESTADALIVKYDNKGNVKWAHTTGGNGDDYITGVATDDLGNVYLSGFYSSPSISFGKTVLYNTEADTSTDIFLVKYDSIGSVIWAINVGGDEDDGVENMTSDAAGNTYICGYFYSKVLMLGHDTLTSYSNGNFDNAFVAKFDANGTALWSATGGGDDYYTDAVGVAVAPSGNVYTTGFFRTDTAYFGNDTLYNYNTDSTEDIFVIKYDASGHQIWLQQSGGTENDEPFAIAASIDESVYITGFFYSAACAFGADTITNSALYYYSFLAKYDSAGVAQWADSGYGNNNNVYGDDVATDTKGNVYNVGNFYSDSVTLGQSIFVNRDNSGATDDIYIAAYSSGGTPLWSTAIGGTGADDPYSLRLDNFGDIYLAGAFSSDTLAFGTNLLIGDFDTIYAIGYVAQLGCVDTPVITQQGNLLTATAQASYQWYVNDTAIAGQTGPSLQAPQNGTFYVAGGSCQLASNTIVVTTAGLKETNSDFSFAVYPNPANNHLVIQSNMLSQASNIPFIIDVTGRQIELPYTFETGKIIFDTHLLSAGMYSVSFSANTQRFTAKFIKTGNE